MHGELAFQNPWQALADSVPFDNELQRELSPGHVLAGLAPRALARRIDSDDSPVQRQRCRLLASSRPPDVGGGADAALASH